MIELESRGLPVAWVDTPNRLPRVRRRGGVFVIESGAARPIGRPASRASSAASGAALAKRFEKFGLHRALRAAGAKPGDRVRVGELEVRLWPYPEPALPGVAEGIRGYRYLETPPFARLSRSQLKERASELAPRVIVALTR